jgi:transcriptional regulator with XRE-family HTH domain
MADRGDLATLLRAWRDRLHPAAVGLPSGPNRRTAGVRREELAMLAGLSVDYVIRLEQGRAERPSEQVVASLARVLQLGDDERDALFVAAGLPAPLPTSVPRTIPPTVHRLLYRMPDTAVAVYAADWTLLATNPAWDLVHGAVEGERNMVARQFLGGPSRLVETPGHAEHFERAMVSDLRGATIRYPQDQQLRALVHRMIERSPRFAAMWSDVEVATHRTERKTIDHPVVGPLTFDCDTLVVAGTDVRVVLFTPEPGTEDASKFDLLRTVGVTSVG